VLISLSLLFIILSVAILWFFPSIRYKKIVVHHSASPGGTLKSIRKFHQEVRGWHEIAYHFVIGNGSHTQPVGKIEASKLWRRRMYHFSTQDLWLNVSSIAIVMVGNFQIKKADTHQYQSLLKLIRRLQFDYNISLKAVIGHNDVQKTTCPGRFLNLSKLRQDLMEIKASNVQSLADLIKN